MATEISNSNDIIDSRDLIEIIDDMETERGYLVDAVEDAEELIRQEMEAQEDGAAFDPSGDLTDALRKAQEDLDAWDENNGEEFATLKAFAAEFEDYCDDWTHGVTLIRESYFTEYAEDFVKDVGDLPKNIPDYLVIDWDATAENLKVDYTEGTFDGVTYLAR